MAAKNEAEEKLAEAAPRAPTPAQVHAVGEARKLAARSLLDSWKIDGRPNFAIDEAEFLRSIDHWRRKQPDRPSRAEAIRRLVELGLSFSTKVAKAK